MPIIILLVCICSILWYLYIKEKQENKNIQDINEERIKANEEIEKKNTELLKEQIRIENQIEDKQKQLKIAQDSVENMEEVSKNSFENYCDLLEEQYRAKEEEYKNAEMLLKESYGEIQDEIAESIAQIRSDLDKISSTRAAAIQAQIREEQIKQQQEFYSLTIDDIDKKEAHILQSIESELRDPRPLRMIIWTAYYIIINY